ncbi:lysophospholipid acyltransferase family protein [Sphingobacterium sp. T2]|uniref:lysophospholipid acyltransferase family protein n=1 Tax=Sphingobacterium sp. T2 TaxID=1590596 RepID=UPI000B19EB60|nr:hypothetical protein [Sphingobacterium sp. T2]
MSKSILKIVFWTLSKLPFSVLYLLSDVLYVLIYYIIGYRKKVVFKNLRNSFPEKSEEEILHIAKKFYRYFPDLIVECIKMANLSAEEVLKRMELINEEEVHRHLNAGKAIIGVTAHYSNWEWGIFRLSLLTEHPKLIIYKPLNNKAFDEVYNDIRTRFGATMVPMKQILRHIVRLRQYPPYQHVCCRPDASLPRFGLFYAFSQSGSIGLYRYRAHC